MKYFETKFFNSNSGCKKDFILAISVRCEGIRDKNERLRIDSNGDLRSIMTIKLVCNVEFLLKVAVIRVRMTRVSFIVINASDSRARDDIS